MMRVIVLACALALAGHAAAQERPRDLRAELDTRIATAKYDVAALQLQVCGLDLNDLRKQLAAAQAEIARLKGAVAPAPAESTAP